MNRSNIEVIPVNSQILQRQDKWPEIILGGDKYRINRLLSAARSPIEQLSRSIPDIGRAKAVQVRQFLAVWVNGFWKYHEPRPL